MNTFRNSWYYATFGADQSEVESDELGGDDIVSVLAEFGPAFIELARPIWAIQAAALGEARWMRRDRTEENSSKREAHHNCENIDEGPAK